MIKLCGNHYYACDCREEYVKKLEHVAEAAENFIILHPGKKATGHAELEESLQALRGSTK